MKQIITAILLCTAICTNAQKPAEFKTELTSANVYYGYGAELTHKVKAQLQQGSQEIVLSNVSTSIDANTIQISVPENAVLLSFRHNVKTIPTQIANPIIKRTEDSVVLIKKQINVIDNNIFVNEDLLTKTTKIIDGYTSSPDKSLSAIELMKLIDYYTGKVQGYRAVLYQQKLKKDDLNDSITVVNARLYELKKDGGILNKYIGEMILQLMTTQAFNTDINLSYFTRNAGWLPTYDMRVKSIDNSFKLVYKASVTQSTGIDWKQVKLTLSTNNPNQGNSIPVINPWNLQLYVPELYNNNQSLKDVAYSANRAQSLSAAKISIRGMASNNNNYEYEESVPASNVSNFLTLNESQLNTSFDIDLPYDIPSNNKAYSVTIKDENLKASYKHYAIPKLDKDAFLLAEISDWENLNLLPGDANIIMDDTYLGKSYIDPNTTMDTLNLSLGRDKRIALKRLPVKDFTTSKTRGDNKTETFTYEITVKNNKKQDVAMLLKDNFPISQVKEVVVKLDDAGGAEINPELGTVNWNVNLKPGEQKKYRFTYSVTYPKDKKIANLR